MANYKIQIETIHLNIITIHLHEEANLKTALLLNEV